MITDFCPFLTIFHNFDHSETLSRVQTSGHRNRLVDTGMICTYFESLDHDTKNPLSVPGLSPEKPLAEREPPPRSCKKFLMVRNKTEVPLFLIVFDLLFQMQGKSRRSISKKSRIALVDLI